MNGDDADDDDNDDDGDDNDDVDGSGQNLDHYKGNVIFKDRNPQPAYTR